MRCFSIFSPSLSVIPPTFSKKIDPEMRSIAFFNMIGAKFSDQRKSMQTVPIQVTNQRLTWF